MLQVIQHVEVGDSLPVLANNVRDTETICPSGHRPARRPRGGRTYEVEPPSWSSVSTSLRQPSDSL